MSATRGLFEPFQDLENLSIPEITDWLTPIPPIINLENHLANRILYPQTLPVTKEQLKIDLAILRAILKRMVSSGKASQFLDIKSHKIIIPSELISCIPNLNQLMWAFVDGLLTQLNKTKGSDALWLIVLSGELNEVMGTLLVPQFEGMGDLMQLGIQGKIYKVKAGDLTVIPCNTDNCRVIYKISKGSLLGVKESSVDLRGGKLGIMIDGRINS